MNNLIKSQVLIDKYSDMIYRIAVRRLKNKEDAKDIVQEVLMKYVSAIYKGKEFETKDDEKYWLIRVAINTCNSQVRRLKFKRLLKMELNTITMVDTTSENIIEMMNILSPKYREVFELHYIEDLKVSDVSKILNISEANVKQRLKRARDMIKEYKEKEDKIYEQI